MWWKCIHFCFPTIYNLLPIISPNNSLTLTRTRLGADQATSIRAGQWWSVHSIMVHIFIIWHRNGMHINASIYSYSYIHIYWNIYGNMSTTFLTTHKHITSSDWVLAFQISVFISSFYKPILRWVRWWSDHNSHPAPTICTSDCLSDSNRRTQWQQSGGRGRPPFHT